MADSSGREHHFVPQFYLRAFSADGKRINLFNFERRRVIRNASIKNQCSRRNLYKFVPQLEGALAELEGAAADVIRNIRETGTLPPIGNDSHSTLLTFIVFQHLRTTSASRATDVMGDYFAKAMLENQPEIAGINLDDIEVRHAYPVAFPLSMAGHVATLAQDLRMHLFINRSDREFMTSDDPVVLHNQYCEGIKHQGVLGWGCRGLQVVLPLSPDHLVLLFDPSVYKVGASHRGVDVTLIDDGRDVSQLNALQVLNCQENVYFLGLRSAQAGEQHCHALCSSRPKTRVRIVETEAVPDDEDHSSSLVHQYEPLLPLRLSVTSIRVRREPRRVPLFERTSLYRDGRGKRALEVTRQSPKGATRYRIARIIDK